MKMDEISRFSNDPARLPSGGGRQSPSAIAITVRREGVRASKGSYGSPVTAGREW